MSATPTWFDTLDLKPGVSLGSIWKMVDYAKALGYTYFVWNDRIYSTQIADQGALIESAYTGFIVDRSFIVGETQIRRA